jgi:hypothetical protein
VRRTITTRALLAVSALACACTPPVPAGTARPSESTTPGETPGPRTQPILLYDDRTRTVLLFDGAYPSAPAAQDRLTRLWSWNGTQWRALTGSGPTVRYASAAAYDSRRGRVVSHSGRVGPDGRITPDTWEWDGTEWHRMTDTSAGGRDHHVMAYDATRQRTVMFGGGEFPRRAGPWSTDTWEWDGSRWTRVATEGPTGRAATAMVYDGKRRHVVLFGGVGRPAGSERRQPSFADTWVWDGTTWKKVAEGGPPARNRHAMAFDSRSGVVLLYGGGADGVQFADMWRWDGRTWTAIPLTGRTPGPRELHSMAYDPARGRTVLYGGNSAGKVLHDTWEWDGERWSQLR